MLQRTQDRIRSKTQKKIHAYLHGSINPPSSMERAKVIYMINKKEILTNTSGSLLFTGSCFSPSSNRNEDSKWKMWKTALFFSHQAQNHFLSPFSHSLQLFLTATTHKISLPRLSPFYKSKGGRKKQIKWWFKFPVLLNGTSLMPQ